MNLFCTILSSLLISTIAFGIELKDPPKGFKWNQVLEGKSAVLVPKGWYFTSKKSKNTEAYFVTKEVIDPVKGFKTGMTLNILKGIKKSSNLSPSQYASSVTEKASKISEVLLNQKKQMGLFKAIIFKVRDVVEGEKNTIIHSVYIANDKTDTLWLYFFEAPEEMWVKEWKIGEVMMKTLLLDDKV